MDEARAINLCLKHRDPVGFDFLVSKYRREAFVHARTLMGNEHDALDACQESFARAFAALPRLEHLTSFYPWFYRILRNCCLNMLDRRVTRDRYAESEADEQRIDSVTPASLMEQQEERAAVRTALQRLPAGMREILAMKYMEGRSYDEIAGLLGIPRGTVMSRLYHARLAFKDQYLLQPATLTETIS
jgi:RNA polymerase sigma-70 factor (ECF subfamily)